MRDIEKDMGMPPRRTSRALGLLTLVAAAGTACAPPATRPQGSETHSLPRLPELGTVVLPGGFEADDDNSSYPGQHPINVDSAYFGLDLYTDAGGSERCRAQIVVSPFDKWVATPVAYADLLSTNLCDPQWFATQNNPSWRRDPADPHLWTLDFMYGDFYPAVAVVLFVPAGDFTVGLWALTEVYPPDAAVAVVREVAGTVG